MIVLPLLLLGRILVAVSDEPPLPAPAPPTQILFVDDNDSTGADTRALLDTVAIYTRDLRVRVHVIAPDTANALSSHGIAELIRARGARLAFWCAKGPRPHAVTLFVVDAKGDLRREILTGEGPHGSDVDRVIALKLRSVLTGEGAIGAIGANSAIAAIGAIGAQEHTPAPTQPASNPVAPTDDRKIARPEDRANTHPSVTATAAVNSSPTSDSRVFASVGYRLSHAPGRAPAHQSLALEGGVAIGSAMELGLGLELTPAADTATSTEANTSVRDVPVRLSARWIHHGGLLDMGLGLFGAAHVLAATATGSDGRRNTATAVAGAAGCEAVARAHLLGRVAWDFRVWVEGFLSRTRFLIGQNAAFDTGPLAVGVGLGILYPTR